MTEYQRQVDAGEIPPCTSMEWLFLHAASKDILNNPEELNKFDAQNMLDLKIEIEHLYRENPEKFKQIMDTINKVLENDNTSI